MLNKILALVKSQVGYGGEVFSEMLLDEDLGFDSIDTYELAIVIERELGIEARAPDISQWLTVQDVIDAVERWM